MLKNSCIFKNFNPNENILNYFKRPTQTPTRHKGIYRRLLSKCFENAVLKYLEMQLRKCFSDSNQKHIS